MCLYLLENKEAMGVSMILWTLMWIIIVKRALMKNVKNIYFKDNSCQSKNFHVLKCMFSKNMVTSLKLYIFEMPYFKFGMVEGIATAKIIWFW